MPTILPSRVLVLESDESSRTVSGRPCRLALRHEVVDALFRLGNLRRGHFLDPGGVDVGAVVGVAVRGGQAQTICRPQPDPWARLCPAQAMARLSRAPPKPRSAALRNQSAAAASSCGTPLPAAHDLAEVNDSGMRFSVRFAGSNRAGSC